MLNFHHDKGILTILLLIYLLSYYFTIARNQQLLVGFFEVRETPLPINTKAFRAFVRFRMCSLNYSCYLTKLFSSSFFIYLYFVLYLTKRYMYTYFKISFVLLFSILSMTHLDIGLLFKGLAPIYQETPDFREKN